ncbi:MAG: hypothetical protein LBR05_06055 [Azoarcus sp.]|jgi:hypothetical protein|nr:hypothetical protein [Azoarcus sp.]
MGTTIKKFANGSFLEYDKGSFDDWCVYFTDPRGFRKPPKDEDYFQELKDLAKKYGVDRIYGDYVLVYEKTGKTVNDDTLRQISDISKQYHEDALQMDILLTVLYMAMIAEERKANTRLGKRIKRLGIYYLLVENAPVPQAANFMRGMGWRAIDALCKARGF